MSQPPDSVSKSLERMMSAARRLDDAGQRITHEEAQLLSECSTRIRLYGRGQVIPYPKQQDVATTHESPGMPLPLLRARV